jgi:lipoprotein-releasing system permease protein
MPNMPFELQIAVRYLLARRKQAAISVSSFISVLGVTVGVMAVVIALALMTGLQTELRDRVVGANPHIYVWKQSGFSADYKPELEKLKAIPHVVGAAPEILGQGLLSATTVDAPVQVKGIDPALEGEVTDIRGAILTGSIEALQPQQEDDRAGILLGKDLAMRLNAKEGDVVQITSAHLTLSPAGPVPRTTSLRVAGTFSLGLYELDTSFGFVSLDVAKRLFDKPGAEMVQLRVDDIYLAPDVARTIQNAPGSDYITQDWADMNRSLFSALWLEKLAISLAIGLIVVVAALNIVASLILLVMEKHRDIAILKTMGASARSVTAIFMIEGLIIGLLGASLGAIGGALIATVVDRYELIPVPPDVYMVSHMPLMVIPVDVMLVALMALVICFGATIYPSRQAARLDPAQALRYE